MAKKSKAKLLEELKKLSKKADRRMREIEKLSRKKKWKNMKKWAYAHAARSAKAWGAKGKKPRFDIKPPETVQGIEAKIRDIEEFLSMKTSLKSTTEKVWKERAKKIAKDLDLKEADWEVVAAYYERELNKKVDDYGYQSALSAFAQIRKQKSALNDAFKNNKQIKDIIVLGKSESAVGLPEDAVVIRGDDNLEKQTIERMLSEHMDDLIKIGLLK